MVHSSNPVFRAAEVEHSLGDSGFASVDVGDDPNVANLGYVGGHGGSVRWKAVWSEGAKKNRDPAEPNRDQL
ncbi:hypothetical protein RBSH_04728 [Rhodopirellula baltica SH28]|uniref:Uncharacterized protein n=3 Tax=Rhodopirellula baltica TaxID=265606 RepID=F2ATA2_RHOBT|nr:hypothetical protein RBWH47_04107 [Rhodopirellula baltica WH47]EKK00020.1 hypothetical protein RBSH_04728 [Rhodopirellula baltica SH28]ELP34265.1 hypothetical protein RBSWK_01827 [Rhodopirellula baltica SWK14]